MQTIQALIKELRDLKNTRFYPGTEATPQEIAKWEKQKGFRLPEDYKHFLAAVGECRMHPANPGHEDSFAIRFFALKQVVKASEHIGEHIEEEDEDCKSWYAFADAQDGNCIIMDLATVKGASVKIIDGFHETAPYDLAVISESFTEFLERSIADPNTSSGGGDIAKGTRYWSTPGGFYGEVNPS